MKSKIAAVFTLCFFAVFAAQVTAQPDINVTPDSLNVNLLTGEIAVETLTVSNEGSSDLNFEISIEGVSLKAVSLNTIPNLKTEKNIETEWINGPKHSGNSEIEALPSKDDDILVVDGVWKTGQVPASQELNKLKSTTPSAIISGDTVLINFDDLVQPCSFNQTIALSNEYSIYGVIFQGPSANDGGGILDQCGSFGVLGHSPPNFLAFNSSAQFSNGGRSQGPETMLFNAPVSMVEIKAGSRFSLPLTMEAFDVDGNLLKDSTIILSPTLQSLLVQTNGIAKVVISSSASVFVLDDLRFAGSESCCIGTRGDLNSDGDDANILDLTFAVDRIFRGGAASVCPEEADVNADGTPHNILDLTYLVDRIFRGGPVPPGC